MNLSLFSESEFEDLILRGRPLIDVRAPVEFAAGSIPGSVNLPILSDDERAQVGTCYKMSGQQAAIELGQKLVSGATKAKRVEAWIDFMKQHPSAAITCFRGGLRSQTAQRWIDDFVADKKMVPPRVDGGYKKLRTYLLSTIERFSLNEPLTVISGATGSGKSLLLRSLFGLRKVNDLEKWAHHRGSAFGGYLEAQPTQIDFENKLAVEMLHCLVSADRRATLIEDESRLIGRSVQPEALFTKLRASPVVFVEESLAVRVEITFQDYVLNSDLNSTDAGKAELIMQKYRQALRNISKKLGGLRASVVATSLENAWAEQQAGKGFDAHREWIEKLLVEYYDPMYFSSLEKRAPKILFSGARTACFEYLKSES